MPKINVYLPDELAEAVRDAGIPVSAICQRALEVAVRRITAIRNIALEGLDIDGLAERLPRFTLRARAAVALAIEQARAAGSPDVGTGHLLGGVLAEGGNLALQVLSAMEIDPEQVRRDLAARSRTGGHQAAEAGAGAPDPGSPHFTGTAASTLEFAVSEAVALGHNYIGCEHLLLGLVTEPDGTGGQVLRALGAEPRLTRRAVSAALAGYVHLRAQAGTGGTGQAATGTSGAAGGTGAVPKQAVAAVLETVRAELQPLIARIERLEQRTGTAGTDAG